MAVPNGNGNANGQGNGAKGNGGDNGNGNANGQGNGAKGKRRNGNGNANGQGNGAKGNGNGNGERQRERQRERPGQWRQGEWQRERQFRERCQRRCRQQRHGHRSPQNEQRQDHSLLGRNSKRGNRWKPRRRFWRCARKSGRLALFSSPFGGTRAAAGATDGNDATAVCSSRPNQRPSGCLDHICVDSTEGECECGAGGGCATGGA